MSKYNSIASGGWKCSKCTFYHHNAAPRCAMCCEPRVSKTQMRDFILGKPIPDDSALSPSRQKRPPTTQSTIPWGQGGHNSISNKSPNGTTSQARAAKRPCHNPYKKNSTATASTVKVAPASTNLSNSTNNHNSQPRTESNRFTSSIRPVATSSHPPPKQPQQLTLSGKPAPTGPPPTFNNRTKSSTKNQHPPKAGLKAPPPIALSNNPPMRATVFQPGPVPVCAETAGTWIYPNDPQFPKRAYQFSMTQTALFHNTLVSLPTGLGKTLIAAVVLYNYYRWFPTGKVIFLAPTLPLVTQKSRYACYDIMGIPEKDTAVMTGKTLPDKRRTVWNTQRVFFCTPQTVQKDLESQRMDPKQIVCIVLDEAHKATGDYAYCKVVEQLEQAGAKFRILGLSATPGSTIKAIQTVVDALRINKVDARREDDPDVKQYIHDRHTEEIIVQQVSACKDVQAKLTDILVPLLERIRARGGMGRFSGCTNLSHWVMLQARIEYVQRTSDNSLSYVFLATQKLVKIREDLNKSGIGAARTALARLKNEPQKGDMARIVASKPFEELWELVSQSSFDPASNDQSIEHKVMNNPKLAKLREILVEHFERAKAAGNSSRSIVFSQFRDSVSEIVDLLSSLRPLIRPRHFVGQAKGAQNEDGGRLKGMAQKEQQQVIKQFRDDVFNVLVCTCIGEEGLDIGEVDLIVNFDTLKSPIRMIQRVGRTGRRRSGRVVCLIAEGSEQNTSNQSKLSERNLALALRRSEAFIVTPTVPLLPSMPMLKEQNMQISQNFRMSQVEGHGGSATGSSAKAAEARKSKAWRLSNDAEARRAAVMGSSNTVSFPMCEGLPRALQKQVLLGRLQQGDGVERKLSSRLGRVSAALLLVESQQGLVKSVNNTTRKRRRALNDTEHYVNTCFPLSKKENGFNSVAWGTDTAADSKTHPLPRKDEEDLGSFESRPPTDDPERERSGRRGAALDQNASKTASLARHVLGKTNTVLEPQVKPQTATAQRLGHEIDSKHHQTTAPMETGPVETKQSAVLKSSTNSQTQSNAGQTSLSFQMRKAPLDHFNDQSEIDTEQFEELRLPTPCSSSDEESESDENDIPASLPSHGPARQPVESMPTIPEDTLFLPSQDSSSDESDAERESSAVSRPMENKVNAESVQISGKLRAAFRETAGVHRTEVLPESATAERASSKNAVTKSAAKKGDVPHRSPFQRNKDGDVMRLKGRKRRVIDDSPGSVESFSSSLFLKSGAKTVGTKATTPALNRATSRFDVLSGERLRKGRLSFDSKSVCSASDELVDTQKSAEEDIDVVCGICSSGESPSEDPIVLCDGPTSGIVKCDVAVHASCYSIPMAALDEKHWRCDICQYKYNGGTVKPRCLICKKSSGPMKIFLGNEWIHNHCKNSVYYPDATADDKPSGACPDESDVDKQRRRRKAMRAIRKEKYGGFFDEEAAIASDEDVHGDDADEELAREIEEEEEFHRDFINDSSQLGYTQDDLERVDPAVDDEHRALDAERALNDAFATPMLNRQMRHGGQGRLSDASSVPSSVRGLGQMHFIRSVIEHHRQGGDADQIEQAYQEMEAQATPADEDQESPPKPKRRAIVDDSDSD